MKYIVGIPYRNRIDLLRDAINSIKCYWDNLVLIDNSGCQELSTQGFGQDFLIIEPIVPLTFTQSQNAFIRIANERACDFYMYMHNDAVAENGTSEKLLELIQQLFDEKRNWGALFTDEVAGFHPDLLAAYNMEAVNNVGQYDTVFPDYFSDCDYYRRMIIKGYELINSELKLIHQNGGSNTINSDYVLKSINNRKYVLHRQYYIAKWGGEPGREIFTVPFNAQDEIMALLTFMQQEYGPTTTLEQVIKYHPSSHHKAQQAIKKYGTILPWPLRQNGHLANGGKPKEEENKQTSPKSPVSTRS